jgi:hypothetical protein
VNADVVAHSVSPRPARGRCAASPQPFRTHGSRARGLQSDCGEGPRRRLHKRDPGSPSQSTRPSTAAIWSMSKTKALERPCSIAWVSQSPRDPARLRTGVSPRARVPRVHGAAGSGAWTCAPGPSRASSERRRGSLPVLGRAVRAARATRVARSTLFALECPGSLRSRGVLGYASPARRWRGCAGDCRASGASARAGLPSATSAHGSSSCWALRVPPAHSAGPSRTEHPSANCVEPASRCLRR